MTIVMSFFFFLVLVTKYNFILISCVVCVCVCEYNKTTLLPPPNWHAEKTEKYNPESHNPNPPLFAFLLVTECCFNLLGPLSEGLGGEGAPAGSHGCLTRALAIWPHECACAEEGWLLGPLGFPFGVSVFKWSLVQIVWPRMSHRQVDVGGGGAAAHTYLC